MSFKIEQSIITKYSYLISFNSLRDSCFCFFISSKSLRARARSLTARSRSRRMLSHRVRTLSLSCTILSRSLMAQSLRFLAISASCLPSESVQTIQTLATKLPSDIATCRDCERLKSFSGQKMYFLFFTYCVISNIFTGHSISTSHDLNTSIDWTWGGLNV